MRYGATDDVTYESTLAHSKNVFYCLTAQQQNKSRPGIIEFSELMKKHKFSVTPKSLFDPGGLPLQFTDRACFMKGLRSWRTVKKGKHSWREKLTVIAVDSDEKISTVIAIYCMGIVNQLKIGGGNKTVSDLADQFVLKVITESSGYGTLYSHVSIR